MKEKPVLVGLMLLAAALSIATISTTTPVVKAEQGEHGSASEDFKGQPADANNWGDLTSDRASSEHDIGEHSREGAAPGNAPFDDRDDTKGRIGIGNNVGDGPSGHGTCVDNDPDNDDALC